MNLEEPAQTSQKAGKKTIAKRWAWGVAFLVILLQGGFFINENDWLPSFQCNFSQNSSPENDVPQIFTYQDYQKVVKTALKNYVDPKRVDKKRMYFSSALAALRALPTSLSLFTKEFYENRKRFVDKELLLDGKAILVEPNDDYIIFVPDYKNLETKRKKANKKKKKLSRKQRTELAIENRRKQRRRKEYRDRTIAKISFTQKDFVRVLNWIEKNGSSYLDNANAWSPSSENKKREKKLKMNAIFFSATNGALQSLDPHSGIIPKKAWKKSLASAEDSSFEGIGAMLRGGGQSNVVIETPLPGSPALRSGIRAGDIIRKVDGKTIDNLSLDQVVKKIRGPKNTIVKLEVERELELEWLLIPIKRNVIEQKAVSSKLLTKKQYRGLIPQDRPIAYIKINSFLYARKNTSKLIQDEIKQLTSNGKKPIQFLILDLRNNPGGYLEEAVSVADLFLPKNKKIVQIKTQSQEDVLKTKSDMLIGPNVSIIILINANSASASEILTSAMMDYDRALVVGDRSFGKATVQGIQPLDRVILKLTTARYYSPRGYTVQVSGIKPDFAISDEVDGSFPPSFREEDMWDHLPSLKEQKISEKRKRFIKDIQAKVKNNRIAETYIQRHKDDALKVDAMLVRSFAYLYASKK